MFSQHFDQISIRMGGKGTFKTLLARSTKLEMIMWKGEFLAKLNSIIPFRNGTANVLQSYTFSRETKYLYHMNFRVARIFNDFEMLNQGCGRLGGFWVGHKPRG